MRQPASSGPAYIHVWRSPAAKTGVTSLCSLALRIRLLRMSPVTSPVVTRTNRERFRAIGGWGHSVAIQSPANPAAARSPRNRLLMAPSKLQESSVTQPLEITRTTALVPGTISDG